MASRRVRWARGHAERGEDTARAARARAVRDVTLGLGLGLPSPSLTLTLSYHLTAAACPRAWAVGGEELDHLRGLTRPPPKPKRKPKPKVSARTPRPWPQVGDRPAEQHRRVTHAAAATPG